MYYEGGSEGFQRTGTGNGFPDYTEIHSQSPFGSRTRGYAVLAGSASAGSGAGAGARPPTNRSTISHTTAAPAMFAAVCQA
jgi:hypothetical protein